MERVVFNKTVDFFTEIIDFNGGDLALFKSKVFPLDGKDTEAGSYSEN